MMAGNLRVTLRERFSYEGLISRKKAQKAQRMQESDYRSPLLDKVVRPGDANVRDHIEINRLCDTIRQTSFEIHKYFRSGHLEKIYENALTHRLAKLGIEVIQQHPLNVFDEDGALLGHLCADLFVADRLVVEVKASRSLVDEHIAQLLGYLRASRIEHGLLINFGGPKLQIKKYILGRDPQP
jgi:GxxExxY protein